MKKILAAISGLCLVAVSCLTFYRPAVVHAEDSYTSSPEWLDWVDRWHSILNVEISNLTGNTVDADDIVRYNTAVFAYGSCLLQQYSNQLYQDLDTTPAGSFDSGWFYRAGVPHSVITFNYGTNGDPARTGGSMVVCSSDLFTISLSFSPDGTTEMPYCFSFDQSNRRRQYGCVGGTLSPTGSGIVSSGVLSGSRFSCFTPGGSRVVLDSTYTTDNFIYLGSGSISEFSGGYYEETTAISGLTRSFSRAEVSNNFPDFVEDLKTQMYNDFPEEVVDTIWIDPETPYEPIYPTDFVTGMPRDWTVENPPLPTSPQMDISIPDTTLPDLSGLTEYTDGVGFWWALTGHIMDVFGIRTIVLLLIGIGVFAFVIYRLGAG